MMGSGFGHGAAKAGKERDMESNKTKKVKCRGKGGGCVAIGLIPFMGMDGPLPRNGERVVIFRRDGKWQVATFVRKGRLVATGLTERGKKPQCGEDLRAIARCDIRYVKVTRAMATGFYADPHDGVAEMLDSEGLRYWARLPDKETLGGKE